MATESIELTFGVSPFETPEVLKGADAWATQICELIFMEKGTYEHSPDLGVDLKIQKYMDVDTFVREIRSEIVSQVKQWLPDIPLTRLEVSTYFWKSAGTTVVVIGIWFNEDGRITSRNVYASTKDELLTYVISKFN